jgi:hypothetical protein
VNNTSRLPMAVMLLMALTLAACGGGAQGGGGGGGGDSDLPDAATATSEDAEGTTYQLQEGRYRLTWRAPDCEDVVVSITTADGSFAYEQAQRLPTSFIRDMPAGEYTVAVTSDCAEWEIQLDKF